MTMTLFSTYTVGAGGIAQIDFSSIPATATDIMIKCSLRNSGTPGEFLLRFNGSTTGYSDRWLAGDGASTFSITNANIDLFSLGSGATANTFSSTDIYIPNYAGSTNKSVSADSVQENNISSVVYALIDAALWSNTAAITSVSLVSTGTSFVQNSVASLYLITKGSGGATVS